MKNHPSCCSNHDQNSCSGGKWYIPVGIIMILAVLAIVFLSTRPVATPETPAKVGPPVSADSAPTAPPSVTPPTTPPPGV